MHSSTRCSSILAAVAALLFFLTGCGGGGGSGSPGTTGTANLTGQVVLRDGSTSNLDGVTFTLPRTGRTVRTAPDGSFDFGSVPAGTLTVRLGGGTSGLTTLSDGHDGTDGGTDAASGDSNDGSDDGSAEDESGDDLNDDDGTDANDSDLNDDGDDDDTGDDDFDVTSVSNGESVHVSVSIDHGVITSLDVSRSGHHDCESEVRLQRSVSSDDADVTGKVETEARTDRQRIEIEVEHLTAGRSVRAVLIAPDLSEADLGPVAADDSGEARWEVNTADGDGLPFGVATVAELAGDGIEIRDAAAGTVLLFGTMPETPTSVGETDGARSRGRASLTAGPGAVGEAHVEIESRTDGESREELKVEVEHEVAGLTLDFFLEDPAALGTFALIGTVTVDGEHEAELEIEAEHGEALPFGVTGVSGLVGLRVEVRNATGGTVLYSGAVPALVAHD